MIDTIYLDLDGVCCQWWESALALFPDAPPIPATGPIPYWVGEHIGVSREDVDDRINSYSSGWWENLPEYIWFRDLYTQLSGFRQQIVFLTASGHFPYAPNGKVAWMQKRFGKDFSDFIITRHKHLLANYRSILIDDSPEMIDRFREHHGWAVMFPQRWNKNIGHLKDPVQYVVDRVSEILDMNYYVSTGNRG
jgi:5' nucleotidase, deoxy (Pyrimidine), cytosolic type C protein (NT5C)